MADSKETVFSRHKTNSRINSQRLAACTRRAQVPTRWDPSTERVKRMQALTPNQESISNG